jgi:hypothetical protein
MPNRRQGRIMIEYKMLSAIIIGKISQSKGDWVLENFRISIGKQGRVVQIL